MKLPPQNVEAEEAFLDSFGGRINENSLTECADLPNGVASRFLDSFGGRINENQQKILGYQVVKQLSRLLRGSHQ